MKNKYVRLVYKNCVLKMCEEYNDSHDYCDAFYHQKRILEDVDFRFEVHNEKVLYESDKDGSLYDLEIASWGAKKGTYEIIFRSVEYFKRGE